MAGVDVDTITMKQYLALSQENQAPGVVKPKIRGNVNFEIKSQFMRELREDTFFGNKMRMHTITLIGSSASLAYSIFLESLKTQSCSEFFPLLLPDPQKGRWTDLPQELSIPGISSKRPLSKGLSIMNRQQLDSQGPIPGMRLAQALTAIQTMADHSQKWHDGTTSRNIGSSSSKDGLVALVNKLDNLGRDIKKLKESVHATQVGCQIYEGPHLDKDCPLNEEVKQVKEVRYGEFGQTFPFNRNNRGKFHVGPPGYYTKTDNRPPYGERRQSLEELLAKHQEESARRSTEMEVWIKKVHDDAEINTRNQNASLKNLETQIEQLTKELRSMKENSKQAKVVIVEHEGPSSPNKIKNLHGISFLSDSQEENTNDKLPTKESNPGHFTLPCAIGNFNFYAMADLGASVNVLPRNIFEYLELTNLSETKMLVEMADMRKKAPLGIFTEALDPDKNPLERCLDEYNWVFHKEIEQLSDEYEIKIKEMGQVLEEIWIKCKRARCKNKDWWYDYWYEDEEKTELGNEDYDPPMVHTETFEVTKYKFNNGCSFICVNGENSETLSLGRKNGSRFRKMIMEEMEEVLGNDGKDSNNENSEARRQLSRPA
ncbi:zinc knuckle CX2CX4HX4C containing protein [Tanacetum coccineum]|uniref:Zinc knuckle CX2CX4HX4C containing protein n=1 Tax=Tanacetum coccineum TaxID=301880 RepID=A0ABQ5EYV8_9ASTR